MLFEWDPAKAAANEEKHGVQFIHAASVFLDPLAWTFADPDHSAGETRFITIGREFAGQVLVVAHVELSEERIRIISARRATKREQYAYEET